MNNRAKFADHLKRQLKFLERSCEAYDNGYIDEGIRIATIIRVLVHNTSHSTSLLKHLNATTINLATNGLDPAPQSIMYIGGQIKLENGKISYGPNLGSSPFAGHIPLSKWWDQVVMVVDKGHRITRRQIVLGAANSDGGAHVDIKLDRAYAALARDGVLGVIYQVSNGVGSSKPVSGAHLVSLRQMAYELLNSPELLKLANYPLPDVSKQFSLIVQNEPASFDKNNADEAGNLGLALDAEARSFVQSDLDAACRLWQQSGVQFQRALSINPDEYEAANSWGNALSEEAKAVSISDLATARKLWQQAGEKYQQALSIQPNNFLIISNWGLALALEARATAPRDFVMARKLWQLASDKFQQALGIKPDMHDIANKWGILLINEATAVAQVDSVQSLLALDRAESLLLKHVDHAPDLISYNLACVYGIRGDVVSCLRWLKTSQANNGLPDCNKLQTDSDLDAVRSTPEFVDWLLSVCPQG